MDIERENTSQPRIILSPGERVFVWAQEDATLRIMPLVCNLIEIEAIPPSSSAKLLIDEVNKLLKEDKATVDVAGT